MRDDDMLLSGAMRCCCRVVERWARSAVAGGVATAARDKANSESVCCRLELHQDVAVDSDRSNRPASRSAGISSNAKLLPDNTMMVES